MFLSQFLQSLTACDDLGSILDAIWDHIRTLRSHRAVGEREKHQRCSLYALLSLFLWSPTACNDSGSTSDVTCGRIRTLRSQLAIGDRKKAPFCVVVPDFVVPNGMQRFGGPF